ncbi:MAG: hypothetical protein EPN25_10770, partial [Nitrospirae bacterium]
MPGTAEDFPGRLREDLIRNLRIDFFDDDEIAALLSDLDSLAPGISRKAFALCHSLSQAGSSLLPNTVRRIKTAAAFLRPPDLEQWLGHAYDVFDHQGVGALIDFISRIDEEALKRFLPVKGLALREVLPVLETFLKGISGLELKVSSADESYTDTSTVYLRPVEDTFEDRTRNYLVYKFRIAHAWSQIVCGTLTPDSRALGDFLKGRAPDQADIRHPDIASFFRIFPDTEMALDIYSILEGVRLGPFLEDALPGLMREIQAVKQELLRERPSFSGLSEKMAFVETAYQIFLGGRHSRSAHERTDIADALLALRPGTDSAVSMKLLLRLYDICSGLAGDYRPGGHELLLGTIWPEKVSLVLRAARRAQRQRIDGMITRLLEMPDFVPEKRPARPAGQREQQPDPETEYLLIKGRAIELDVELRKHLDEHGSIPGGILVKGADMGGAASPVRLTDLLEEENVAEEAVTAGSILYDEWDYKRGGYKKKWCRLHEKDGRPGHEPFVETTVRRYSGSIRVL